MSRLRNAGVGLRLGLAFGFVALLLVAVVYTGVTGVDTQRGALAETSTALDTRREVLDLKYLAAKFNGDQNAYSIEVIDGPLDASPDDVPSRRLFLEAVADFQTQLDKVEPLLGDDQQAQVQELRTHIGEVIALDERIMTLFREGTEAGRSDATELVSKDATELFRDVESEVDTTAEVVVVAADRVQADANAAADRVRKLMLAAGVVSLLLALGLAVAITRSLTRPLRRMRAVLGTVASGDLTPRVSSLSGDEVGQMGAALNDTLDRMGGTIETIAAGALTLSSASEELSVVSQDMSGTAEETAAQAATVSAAAEQVSSNLLAISAGAEELGASIQEIARNTTDAANVASQAVSVAATTNATVLKLGTSATEIGEVIRVITSIAEQTNLLALNATIEAARAGEGGKGFAVVANEVKDLARKTARSSEEIGHKIESIQADTQQAVAAIAQITAIIGEINDIQTVVAAAVEEQAVTTSEMGSSVTEAAAGSTDIARNIIGVAEAATTTTEGAANTHSSAEELARLANELLSVVGQFVVAPGASAAPGPTANGSNGSAPRGGTGVGSGSNGVLGRDRAVSGNGGDPNGRYSPALAGSHRRS
jgi:methyl-accepting chemotaxis protein